MPNPVENINNLVHSLPNCPSCGSLTSLDRISIQLLTGGELISYVLRCIGGPDRTPCPFVSPMTQA